MLLDAVDPRDVNIEPIVQVLDDRDLSLAISLLRSPAFDGFFVTHRTVTRAKCTFVIPVPRNNLIQLFFRLRLSRRLNNDTALSVRLSSIIPMNK